MLSFIILSVLLIIPQSFGWHSNRMDDSKNQYIYSPKQPSNRGNGRNRGRDDSIGDDLICPFITQGTPPSGNDPDTPDVDTYNDILADLDPEDFINSVFQDIVDLLTDSQECFPADTLGGETNYGGLFVRLAWHCAGVFRATDGAGGCAGGRQRFPPEASWDDNTNLDKARALLYPIKCKYGDALRYVSYVLVVCNTSFLPIVQACISMV